MRRPPATPQLAVMPHSAKEEVYQRGGARGLGEEEERQQRQRQRQRQQCQRQRQRQRQRQQGQRQRQRQRQRQQQLQARKAQCPELRGQPETMPSLPVALGTP